MWKRSVCKSMAICLALISFASAQFNPGRTNPGRTNQKEAIQGTGNKVIRFMPPWTNTSAVLIQNGTETIMTAVSNYCGWFQAKANVSATSGNLRFKQTIGNTYVGAEGPEKVVTGGIPVTNDIAIPDSIYNISDTIWIIGNPTENVDIYANYPNRLGECPKKTISVMMFDWLHGNLGDGDIVTKTNRRDSTTTTSFGNGAKDQYYNDPIYAVSNDFGSGGCDSHTKGMVEPILGANGVPVRAANFPANCKLSDHIDQWFLPQVIAQNNGVAYTNATCRDLELDLADDGLWEAQKDKNSPEKGLFLLDDFKYLDEAKQVKNIFYDNISGHNFGFTMKFQANFEYIPGQKFAFRGDDDVWVFINNRLVVDIGGQHAAVEDSVLLDTIGQYDGNKLIPGTTYQFHIFYVERHTTESNFKMRTSIDLHTEASIFLTDSRSTELIKNYDVWQINKKDALSCDFSNNSGADVDTSEGASYYRLTGGNLGEEGVMLQTGLQYEGITIDPSLTKFSIDTASIAENYALAPGHYYIEVSLKANPSQKTGVWFTIPTYSVPTLVFVKNDKTILGKEVDATVNDDLGKWAYQKYKLNISLLEEWAQVSLYNKTLTLTVDNTLLTLVDENDNPISKVNLDSATKSCSFYIIANGSVSNATLQVKGAATSAAKMFNINFSEPPIPHVKVATLYDRNGDGRGDSLYIIFDKAFDSQNILNDLQVNFGEELPLQTISHLTGNTLSLTSGHCETDKPCGFGTMQFTGNSSGNYTGTMITHVTYIESGKKYNFTIRNQIVNDGVGPIIKSAVKTIDGRNHILTVTFSEALADSSQKHYLDMFEYNCIRGGVPTEATKPNSATFTTASEMSMIFVNASGSSLAMPSVGDKIRLTPMEKSSSTAADVPGNRPRNGNPWIAITGDQDMEITSGGVISLNTDNPIVQSDSATVPMLVKDPNATAKQIAGESGVQGHLISYDVSTLINDQTKKEIDVFDQFINDLMGSAQYDTTITKISSAEATNQLFQYIIQNNGAGVYGISDTVLTEILKGTITANNYLNSPLLTADDKTTFKEMIDQSIEASSDTNITSSLAQYPDQASVINAIINGTIPASTLTDYGVSERVIKAIKDGKLTASNIDNFRNKKAALIDPSEVKLTYKTYYYSHLGHYVNGEHGSISCEDPVYKKDNPSDNCLSNGGSIFLAWNMRSATGKLAATGVYIARLQFKITISGETIKDQTRDFLWGVRRGKDNIIEIDTGI